MAKPHGFELAGHFGVDAGLVWIGDPCYVIHAELDKSLGNDWSEFCNKLDDGDVTSFGFGENKEGLGFAIGTGYGDGLYPVYVRKEDGVISEIRIKFTE